MGKNIGWLNSVNSIKNSEAQECYTPYYAVEPLLKYIDKDKIIWCPFDEEWSAFYNLFKENGYKVIRSHLNEGKDFFTYEPDNYDVIISNPPYSIKDKILERLYELNKPFAMLLPLPTLQGKKRYECFKNGCQALVFDDRIGYHELSHMGTYNKANHFASIYICKDILPRDLVFEKLNKYERPLIDIKECVKYEDIIR